VRWLGTKDLDTQSGAGWNYAFSLLFAALAMAAKSSTVILPVVLCLCAWWIEGRWHWRNLVRTIPLFLMAIAASTLSIWTQVLQFAKGTDPQWARTWPERLAAAGDAVWFYLGKLLWPHPLSANYPRWQIDAGQWVSYLPLLAVIVILAILWLRGRSGGAGSRACFFAFAYFVVGLLPILGLVDTYIFRYSFVFDHFQYLASIGPLALIGTALVPCRRNSMYFVAIKIGCRSGLGRTRSGAYLNRYVPIRQLTDSRQPIFIATLWAGASWLFFRVARSTRMIQIWALRHRQSGSDRLEKQPTGSRQNICYFGDRARVRLSDFIIPKKPWLQSALCAGLLLIVGMASWQRTRVFKNEDALWTDTLAKNPDSWAAHNNVGIVFIEKGQLDDAVAQYQKTLQINPNYPEAYDNLGLALVRKGRVDDAVAQYQKALAINPNFAQAHNDLGLALVQRGQVDDAIAHYQKALKIYPNFVQVHSNLGVALFQKGQLDDAVAQYQKALEISPDFAEAHYNLGVALFRKGQLDDAVAQYQKALEINPNYAEAHNNLGAALFQKGRLDDAVAHCQKALEINPNHLEALYNLGKVFIQKGQLDSAITKFQEVLRLKPDFRPAQDDLDNAEALVRQLEGHK
jgi:tetratricopeptide (TPR) repeat protein